MSTGDVLLRPVAGSLDFPIRNSSLPNTPGSTGRKRGPAKPMSAIAALSTIEIEATLRDKVRRNNEDLLKAFETYDRGNEKCVTEGEFRRILETFCLQLTTEQFQTVVNKVAHTASGAVRYDEFLKKFAGKDLAKNGKKDGQNSASSEAVELLVKEKIGDNLRSVQRAFQMYDYNRDSLVQRSDLRKVLEGVGCKLTDEQFEKFYRGHDLQHRGLMNYRDMLQRLGFSNTLPTSDTPAMKIETTPSQKKGPKQEPAMLKGLSLDQIEVLFRNKMQSNYPMLKKMFLAFDKKLTGFITLEQLRSILSQFTVPMTPELFKELMQRCGVKATGQIAWEGFLYKFQPTYSTENGQTIPIRPAHKFNPIRGSQETRSLREFVLLLDDHVNNAYGSFKKAFLQIDKTHKGYISRKVFRRVISNFYIKLTEGQFNELMKLIDPDQTGKIRYQEFLEVFEVKEDVEEGHKWLKSVHRYNDTQKSVILPWDSIEELLQQRLELYWSEFTRAVRKYDPQGTGFMTAKKLRKILEMFCLPLSDDHYQAMIQGLSTEAGGPVYYPQLLKGLGVDKYPGDTEGLSAQITAASEQWEEQHVTLQGERELSIVNNALNRTKAMTADEVIVRLKDRFQQHQTIFRKAFNKFDLNKKGQISKSHFQLMLESFGYFMEKDQFKELCQRLNFNSPMTYYQFIHHFEDLGAYPASHAEKPNNHIVYPIRGDEYGMTALQVEAKLRSKLRENFEDLRGAFYKFDENHRGYLTKSSFRRMLDSFMCILNDEEFEKFCAKLNLTKDSRVSYKDFLDVFEVRDTVEGHKWWNSVHRYNKPVATKLMTAEEVHKILALKAHQLYTDVSKAFTLFSDKDRGIMTREHFRRLLYNMLIPITVPEFKKLWAAYDPDKKGFLSHSDFLRVVANQFAPSDDGGMSRDIIEGSHNWLSYHHASQRMKHQTITENQALTTEAMSLNSIIQKLVDLIREKYKDIHEAFRKFDRRQKGQLVVSDIQRLLVDLHFFLDDDQMYDLLDRLGFSSTKRTISYEDFLKAFEEGRKDCYDAERPDPGHPNLKTDWSKLSPESAELKIRKMVAEQSDVLSSAFQAFDPDNTSYIKAADFRQVLDNFCFKLSDAQFKKICERLPVQGDSYVNYSVFITDFKESTFDPRQWLRKVEQNEDVSLSLLSMDELQERLSSIVTSQWEQVSKALREVDYAAIGVISKEEFKSVLDQIGFVLNTEKFESLWNIQKVNEFNNLDYHEFLRRYTMERAQNVEGGQRLPLASRSSSRPTTSASVKYGRRSRASGMSRSGTSLTGGRPYTPLVNAEGTENRLQTLLMRKWTDMEKYCREMDKDHKGCIQPDQFQEMLSSLSISADGDDVDNLLLKYDLHNDGTFCYREFLRHVAGTKPDVRLLPSRQKSSLTLQELQSSVKSRLCRCVRDNWKSIRKQLRLIDSKANGRIETEELREILRRHQLNCSEDEFYQVLSKYEQGGDTVDYNQFIKDFLQ